MIDRKLAGQEKVAREALQDESSALMIRQVRSELAEAESVDAVRSIESQGAKVYWSAWRTVAVTFPERICRVCPNIGAPSDGADHR